MYADECSPLGCLLVGFGSVSMETKWKSPSHKIAPQNGSNERDWN